MRKIQRYGAMLIADDNDSVRAGVGKLLRGKQRRVVSREHRHWRERGRSPAQAFLLRQERPGERQRVGDEEVGTAASACEILVAFAQVGH